MPGFCKAGASCHPDCSRETLGDMENLMQQTGPIDVKTLILSAAALAACGMALAQNSYQQQEVGRVLSATPVLQQVAVPRQVCTTDQVEVQQPRSGAGAAIGAIAGGALGNASGGQGAGRAAATVIGAIGGAVLGDRIEGPPETQVQNIQRCALQTFYETRATAYNVVYEFGGRQYSVQMPNDPGPTIALQISPVGASTQVAIPAPQIVQQQPVFVQQPPQVVVTQQYYPYYPRPYLAPLTIGLGIGYWGGGYRHFNHGHGHWR
jgi:uncharacterized protein YcfJ